MSKGPEVGGAQKFTVTAAQRSGVTQGGWGWGGGEWRVMRLCIWCTRLGSLKQSGS